MTASIQPPVPSLADLSPDCREAAAHLNRECPCLALDHAALAAQLDGEGGNGDFYRELRQSRPHLFSDTMVFVGERHLAAMAELVAAVDEVARLPAYQQAVLAWAPEIARFAPPHAGVFLGYDFHLGDEGPRLIEINTNAGGGLLNAKLARAQRSCCSTVQEFLPATGGVEEAFLAMFRQEWTLAKGDAPLKRIAIVDTAPAAQYLAPEFELFRRLFEAAGMAAVVADPGEFTYRDGVLWHDGQAVDLVYNRLTDFALEEAASAPLRQAYLEGAAVVTPHPRAHALFADKRNLVLLSDPARLAELDVPEACRRTFAATIPTTRLVTADQAEQWWQQRKQWFFKPAAGFGSRAAYRGDKLTKRVFEDIIAAGQSENTAYVAQALVPPSERRVFSDNAVQEGPNHLKLDIRAYAYQGEVQLAAARLYQGQTTNFRTAGGGFAAVFAVPCREEEAA
ncbi:hypothetical protein AZSI13_07170 [Azospira sp. I13]|uniref:hypothetical protein n=1 Tax=Azospira sp. I13 TaxID=1765050 RepID=UPI000D481CC6|nr:hypothetical protein [Azospira sp. I13]GBG01390.1 hypothetical protein AZSI13_07170 [Azospira sp. I13]